MAQHPLLKVRLAEDESGERRVVLPPDARKLLVAHGADLTLTLVDEDDGPQTALELAKENGQEEVAAALEAAATAEGLAKLMAEMGVAPAAAAGASTKEEEAKKEEAKS